MEYTQQKLPTLSTSDRSESYQRSCVGGNWGELKLASQNEAKWAKIKCLEIENGQNVKNNAQKVERRAPK